MSYCLFIEKNESAFTYYLINSGDLNKPSFNFVLKDSHDAHVYEVIKIQLFFMLK